MIDLPLRASNEGLLRPRIARAQKIIRLHPSLCFGAKGSMRVSFQLFHRAHSGSKKGTLLLLSRPRVGMAYSLCYTARVRRSPL